MVLLLVKKLAPESLSPEEMRTRCGLLCGAAGIFFNILLFIMKIVIGTIACSISITADAFNNLSDAGSSAVTLCGFWWSGRDADEEHPFGHGRIEYISGILISVLIILVGVELLKSSVEKIISPSPLVFNRFVIIVLVLSILIKLYMALYNSKIGKKIHSATLGAAASDSISDCFATGAVLLSSIFMYFTNIKIDGFVGMAVSLLVTWTGIKSVIETSQPLLGKAPDPEFVNEIGRIVRQNPETIGVHDLVIHDYGPNKLFVSLHMEVDGSKDIFELHDAVELVEMEISEKLGCEAIIHMDPLDVNNPKLNTIYTYMAGKAKEIDSSLKIHDMRMVTGPTHTNIIFDVVLPPSKFSQKNEIVSRLEQALKELDETYYAVIKAEISYCG
ncbi:MAG: cation diffusion facilitator family transporter [Clostridia bacterium]|nr:cation diffusion facilitator family transporter [Clostridia bacterium]